jgi:hypothetical protein
LGPGLLFCLLAGIALGLSVLFTYHPTGAPLNAATSSSHADSAQPKDSPPAVSQNAPAATSSNASVSGSASVNLPGYWPITNDWQIDDAHKALNTLIGNGATNDENQLTSALRRIFYAPIFRHIYEATPSSALFTFCRAQLLLQAYVGNFTSPDVRRRIIDATQNLISPQDQEGQLYGATFNSEQQCNLHGQTLSDYKSTLPPLQSSRLEGPDFDKAKETLQRLRANLHAVNLMD